MLGAALVGPLVGYILDATPHQVDPSGIPHFSASSYQMAFILLPILLGIAIMIALRLPQMSQGGDGNA